MFIITKHTDKFNQKILSYLYDIKDARIRYVIIQTEIRILENRENHEKISKENLIDLRKELEIRGKFLMIAEDNFNRMIHMEIESASRKEDKKESVDQ